MQVVDPHVFGPLWRFNQDFTKLDESGRVQGYRNFRAPNSLPALPAQSEAEGAQSSAPHRRAGPWEGRNSLHQLSNSPEERRLPRALKRRPRLRHTAGALPQGRPGGEKGALDEPSTAC